MRGSERWTVLDGELLRRRWSVRAMLDHYLDQLVDIFDFPMATTSFSTELTSRKASRPRQRGSSKRGDAYMEMESRTSGSKGSRRLKHSTTAPASTAEGKSSRKSSSKSSVCMRERLRRFLHRSTRRANAETPSTRKSLTIGLDWFESGSSRGSALSWLSERSNPKSLAAADDVAFHDCGEEDRPLQCCYASMS